MYFKNLFKIKSNQGSIETAIESPSVVVFCVAAWGAAAAERAVLRRLQRVSCFPTPS
jgi:hypothetical protein